VHVDPIKPTLRAPGIKRLNLKCDKLRSTFAFKFNLRRYNEEGQDVFTYNVQERTAGAYTRPLLSST